MKRSPAGRGIFGIEDEGDEVARQAKLQRMAERIASYDRGYEGNRGGVRSVSSGGTLVELLLNNT